MKKYIIKEGYGRKQTEREINSTEALHIFLKEEFREQWWIKRKAGGKK